MQSYLILNILFIRILFFLFFLLVSIVLQPAYLQAASFVIVDGQTVTTQQNLGNGNIGIIDAGGSLITATAIAIITVGAIRIENNGLLSTTGFNDSAVFAGLADDSVIINTGTLTTLGDEAEGFGLSGNNVSTTNSGTISIAGENAEGIGVIGDDAEIVNSGLITTQSDQSEGIFVLGDSARINNLGTIQTQGDDAYGINVIGNNFEITNSGSISTEGDGAHGIRAEGTVGETVTIRNSGSIHVSGANAYAIRGGDNDVTVDLLPGTSIIGDINLGSSTDNDTVNIYTGISASIAFINVENINLFGSGVVVGNRVIIIDSTAESNRHIPLWRITDSIHQMVKRRITESLPYKPIHVAASGLSLGLLEAPHSTAWVEMIGGRYEREAQATTLAYDFDHAGVNFGYEWFAHDIRFGLIAGTVNGSMESKQRSFESQSDHYYTGVYGNDKLYGFDITASLVIGYSGIDNNRYVVDNVMGEQLARSESDSYFFSPSFSLTKAVTLTERLQLRPSATLSYSIAWLQGYQETGARNSNLTVDDRYIKVVSGRVQLAAAYQMTEHSEFEFRAGIHSRHSNDDRITARVLGNPFNFINTADEDVTGAYAGARLRAQHGDNLTLIADMTGGGNDDENYLSASFQLHYLF